MPAGPSMTRTPPCPPTSADTNAPITFNSPTRPRIGGVTSWPPTSKRPVEDPTGCPVYRLLACHCSAAIVGTRHPRGIHVDAAQRSRDRRRQPTAEHQRRRPRTTGDRAGKQNRQFIGALVERFRHFSDLLLHLVALISVEKILTRRRLIPGQPLVASRTRLAPPLRRSQTRRRQRLLSSSQSNQRRTHVYRTATTITDKAARRGHALTRLPSAFGNSSHVRPSSSRPARFLPTSETKWESGPKSPHQLSMHPPSVLYEAQPAVPSRFTNLAPGPSSPSRGRSASPHARY
ncbi:MAG: hypothetical protein JWR32_4787 [Mycobacterium sp.]|nr:hypothetical protein [Mycobacterium sp.]